MTEITIIYGRAPHMYRCIVDVPVKYQQRGPERKVEFTDLDMLAIGEAFFRAECASADRTGAPRPTREYVSKYNIVAIFGANDAHAAFCPNEPFHFSLPIPADDPPVVQ